MIGLIKNEQLKFFSLKYVWMVLAIPPVLSVISFFSSYFTSVTSLEFLMAKTGVKNPWVFLEITPFTSLQGILPIVTCGLVAISYDLEKQANGWNKLLSLPVKPRKILSVKALVIVYSMLLTLILTLILSGLLNFTLLKVKPEFNLNVHELNYNIVITHYMIIAMKCVLFTMLAVIFLFYSKSSWGMAGIISIIFMFLPPFSPYNFRPIMLEQYSTKTINFVLKMAVLNPTVLAQLAMLIIVFTLYKFFPNNKLKK